jgi:hypothetical protein
MGWAIHRDCLCGGLMDSCILGGADRAMMLAWAGANYHEPFQNCPDALSLQWKGYKNCYHDLVGERMTYIPGYITHLYHGNLSARNYLKRYQRLRRFKFDPYLDIKLTPHGIWEWASDKPEMHKEVKNYFFERKEDKNN